MVFGHADTPPRLKSELWVKAHLRYCETLNMPGYILKRGDTERGGVLLKLDRFDAGTELLEQSLDFDNNRIWRRIVPATPNNGQLVQEKVAKKLSFDPDVWVVEIEDRHAAHHLDDPIED